MKTGIIGAGKIGIAIAALLEDSEFCTSVLVGDNRGGIRLPHGRKARVEKLDVGQSRSLDAFVRQCDAVVSAAPFFLNKAIATACARRGIAYFDLTEDVETTQFIQRLADGAKTTFMPQCGLAPGAINIIGAGIAAGFRRVRSLELRVGALPLYASNLMKYYLSWSTAGLINEYCHLAEALYEGRRLQTIPLEGLEKISIDGVEYEAFNTSGGVATMCDTYEGRIDDLNYKTIRYPGHRDLIRFLLNDLGLARNPKLLTQIFDQEVPMTTQDVVIVYVNAVGTTGRPGLQQRSFMKKIRGAAVSGSAFSAIQLSTAAGLLAVLELFHRGELAPGFVKQESIGLERFMATRWGGRIYGDASAVEPTT
jgi:saccharopine dehydrogenase-like NADP-dependent oxidoreductase